ncbi:MAG: Na/Pi cotransporter family protein [Rhodospirillales bacterium]|nr:Na/Pi cotransporter family protein [Rhodospirillales bacterium]MCB9965278.1 Na/Pi cotransporter family protein [Rhodospirillales bacterium]MCB9972952.1 Na/Pi cotransporter family protein [Rhodospirillales bacterium]
MPSLILLNIVAAVCLLLWGLGHLKYGMMKGFGGFVRKILQAGSRNRFFAVISGVFITLLVQSSTATILILGTFISQGFVELSAGIALALGADLGTALVATLLSRDLSIVMPLLIIFGFILYSFKEKAVAHNLGRVLSGLGLMLLALGIIRSSAEPLADSRILPLVLGPLEGDPFFGVFVAAAMTWLFHSSLAMILLIMSLCTAGLVHQDFGLYLVLGANLGGIMPALIASWPDEKAVRIPLANALIRVTGVCLAFPLVPFVQDSIAPYVSDGPTQVIAFHVLFNTVICLLALPFTGWIGEIVRTLRPDSSADHDAGKVRYLDKDMLNTPSVALANSERETLRMAEIVERMLRLTIKTFEKNDSFLIESIRQEDHIVDRLYGAIKNYLAKLLAREELSEEEATRAVHILSFATNLEHMGDVIDKNLMPLAEKKNRLHHDFSEAGLEEIKEFHRLVLDSLIQAQQVFMSGDFISAQKMLDQKRNEVRLSEERAITRHIKRLRDGVPESMATTSLHLDIIRDYRRINTYATSVAYEVLKSHQPAPAPAAA